MPSDRGSNAGQGAWEAAVAKVSTGVPLEARSRDGIALGPLFAAAQGTSSLLLREAGQPFRLNQRIDHAEPDDARSQASVDIGNGASGLTFVARGAGSARGGGIDLSAAGGLDRCLDELPIQELSIRFDLPPSTLGFVVDAFAAAVQKRGIDAAHLDLDFGFDPLGRLATEGEHAMDPGETIPAIVEHGRTGGFVAAVLRADGRPYHEAGASEAQELAAVVATGVAYLRALRKQEPDRARSSISFTLVADADQMLTIAKFRALRRLWARVEEACGMDPKPIRLHAETAWRMLARRDPPTNLLRNAVAASAAMIGGADSLTVLPHTSAAGLPEAFARRLARNTALVLDEEAQIGRVADPAAGAGGFETVTDALCLEAWRLFQELEGSGGLAEALGSGAWQTSIAETRTARQAEFEAKTAVIVGVTRFMPEGEPFPEQPVPIPTSPLRLPSWRDAEPFEAAR